MSTTPMMQQYLDAKHAHPDALVLFRMGDFYELFYDDAKTAARLLGLTLTSRDKGADAIPMAGFPYHQLESYLGKLIACGMRAAICEQVEDPRKAQGLVKREVVRVVTPGTLTDDALLDPRQNNYLAAVADGDPAGLAWIDLSTGRFCAMHVPAAKIDDELARIQPAECLLSEEQPSNGHPAAQGYFVTRRPRWAFNTATAHEALCRHFGTASLEGFGFDPQRDAPAIAAAGAILDYLGETQKTRLDHVDRLVPFRVSDVLELDQATRRALEIHRTLRDGRREGSLVWVLDRTVTGMGSRLLADWVANPLLDCAAIDRRLDAVAELVEDAALADKLREILRQVYDMERLLARITTLRASPRDLSFLAKTLAHLPALKARLTARRSALLCRLEEELDLCADVRAALEAALEDDCPLSGRDGGFIRAGFHEELDRVRDLARGGKAWIANYQAQQADETGIPTLKVGYNKVFGYYLEISNAHRDKVPDHYLRKQTVKNAERYVTPELKQHEEAVLSADERGKELEFELFVQLRQRTAAEARRLRQAAAILAQVDVLAALADLARARGYVRPRVVDQPVWHVVAGRHPVLDVTEPAGTFVPNDAHLGDDAGRVLLITGPNMAGKSTYIRQVALITLMAQVGSFVPAREATIGVADRIFARVGAGDELTRGQSTFMVEMIETARILHLATPRSLVILDEIGRGTSTYDGMSLAWAVVEHLHDHVGCRTLFATHYHELTNLEASLQQLRNYNVAVEEHEGQVVFLHKIQPGAADRSYGIHVAQLAGVPGAVIQRAEVILAELERQADSPREASSQAAPAARSVRRRGGRLLQRVLFDTEHHPLLDELRRIDVARTTPLEALRLIDQWRQRWVDDKPAD